MLAAFHGHYQVVRLLLQYGADSLLVDKVRDFSCLLSPSGLIPPVSLYNQSGMTAYAMCSCDRTKAILAPAMVSPMLSLMKE